MFARKILVLDMEMTGLKVHIHSALSLGICLLDETLEIIDSEYFLIQPKVPLIYTKRALSINKFKKDELSNHPPISQVVQQFHARFVQKYEQVPLLAGWNVNHDIDFLKDLYDLGNIVYPFSHRVLDVQSVSCFLNQGEDVTFHKELLKYGREVTHNALNDAQDTVFLLKEYSKILNKMG